MVSCAAVSGSGIRMQLPGTVVHLLFQIAGVTLTDGLAAPVAVS